MSNYYRM